jgi:carbon starvation protein
MLFALAVLAIGYRFYSAFLAARVAVLDDSRETPAYTLADGQNYHATNKWVLFGHHFAAISGAGPLVGPVLAAQFGYLPGLLWLVFGVVIAGATQDFLILAASIRHRGRSLAEIARVEIGKVCGWTAIVAILFIVVIALAGLGSVVKKALGGERVALPKGTIARLSVAKDAPGVNSPPAGGLLQLRSPVVLEYPDGARSSLTEGATIALVTSGDGQFGLLVDGNDPRVCTFPLGCSLVVRGSSWGTFTIALTIPIALFVGLYMNRLRKGRVGEASLIGGALVLLATWLGSKVPGSSLEPYFSLSGDGVTIAMAIYGFFAAVLPVWLLLAPRDYLSSYLKLGTIALLVVGVLVVNPKVELPPITQFASTGKGPLFAGKVFPFVFITIMCGAISGFHALVASGTTPKMIQKESHARTIGYGCMLLEGLVGVVALVAASSLPPGDYFAINGRLDQSAQTQAALKEANLPVEDHLPALEAQVQEQLRGRSGGAVSLAVGMANILAPPGSELGGGLVKYWYHFAIMFEALFILTTIDAGTRIARFLLQELFGVVSEKLGSPSSLAGATLSTGLVVATWAWFIFTSSVDTIWPMFGIANQLLAVIALAVATAWIVNSGRARYAWTTAVPLAWVTTTTLSAGWLLLEGFAKKAEQMPERAWQWNLNRALVAVMLGCVLLVLVESGRACLRKLRASSS